ncbi:MAG: LysR substrate-binding domain-containing protein [Pseudomonadota bacterium]
MAILTLKQLRYFEAVAVHGHFGHAADACGVTQPALSMQIKELEQTLATPLFERGIKQIRLTGFGEDIAPRVRDILRAVDELEDLARTASDDRLHRLRLGVIPTIAPYLLPKLIGQLKVQSPGLDIHIREAITSKLIEELQDGRLDVALVALPVSEPALTEFALFDETFVLVRPEADAALPVPNAEALREMRLLLLEEGHCFRDQALSFCKLGPARPREILEASSLATLVQMVGAGMGVTLIPEMAVKIETRSAAVSLARFTPPEPARKIGMIWRKRSPLAEQTAELAGQMRAILALSDEDQVTST